MVSQEERGRMSPTRSIHVRTVSKKLLSSDISSTGKCFLMKCVEPDLLKFQWHIPFCTYSIKELSKAHHLNHYYENTIISALTILNN